MSSTLDDALTINYDGKHWQALDADNNMMTLEVADDEFLPTLPDGAIVANILLPVEQLLNRTFSLPFTNPKFIDQDILAQELEEHTSEGSESWWLAWQAGQSEEGVAGMMMGLPESLRQQIEADERWSQAKSIGSDVWLRLNHQLDNHVEMQQSSADLMEPSPEHLFESPDDEFNVPQGRHIAVFDADVTGVFFGVWQNADEETGSNRKLGFWRAMRRLNWQTSDDLNAPPASLIEDIKRSLHSMGWQDEQAMSTGRLHPQLHAALGLAVWHGHLCEIDELASRRDASMVVAAGTNLNFRHGRWRSGSHLQQFKPWRRSVALIGALMMMWSAAMMWQNYQLEQQVLIHQQRIIDAFHTGLPQEKVMIDALAQLRKAAGGNVSGSQQNSDSANHAVQWLQSMEAIAKAFQQSTWTIKELSFQNGQMRMTGEAKDLQSMNKIHQILQQESGRDVKIQDTDLSGNRVRFKMRWL